MSQPDITIDSGSMFTMFRLNAEATNMALSVSELFLAYLQNKKAAYAEAVVESKLEYHPDPTQQMAAILEHERLKNFVAAYDELLNELVAHAKSKTQPNPESEN